MRNKAKKRETLKKQSKRLKLFWLTTSPKVMKMIEENFCGQSYKSVFLRKFSVIWLWPLAHGCARLMAYMRRKLSLLVWFLNWVKSARGWTHTSKLQLFGTWSMIFAKKRAIFGQILEKNAHFLFIKMSKNFWMLK